MYFQLSPSYKKNMNIFNKIKVANPEKLKKALILENTQAKGIFSCNEYEKLQVVINYLDTLENEEIEKLRHSLPKEGFRKKNIVDYFYIQSQKKDIKLKQNKIN